MFSYKGTATITIIMPKHDKRFDFDSGELHCDPGKLKGVGINYLRIFFLCAQKKIYPSSIFYHAIRAYSTSQTL